METLDKWLPPKSWKWAAASIISQDVEFYNIQRAYINSITKRVYAHLFSGIRETLHIRVACGDRLLFEYVVDPWEMTVSIYPNSQIVLDLIPQGRRDV